MHLSSLLLKFAFTHMYRKRRRRRRRVSTASQQPTKKDWERVVKLANTCWRSCYSDRHTTHFSCCCCCCCIGDRLCTGCLDIGCDVQCAIEYLSPTFLPTTTFTIIIIIIVRRRRRRRVCLIWNIIIVSIIHNHLKHEQHTTHRASMNRRMPENWGKKEQLTPQQYESCEIFFCVPFHIYLFVVIFTCKTNRGAFDSNETTSCVFSFSLYVVRCSPHCVVHYFWLQWSLGG